MALDIFFESSNMATLEKKTVVRSEFKKKKHFAFKTGIPKKYISDFDFNLYYKKKCCTQMYPKEIFITWYSLLSMAPKQITPQASPHHSTRLKQIFITSNPPQKKKKQHDETVTKKQHQKWMKFTIYGFFKCKS